MKGAEGVERGLGFKGVQGFRGGGFGVWGLRVVLGV